MVVRPRHRRRRLSRGADGGGIAGQARAVLGGRRSHLQGHLRSVQQADDAGPRRAGAGHRQFRTGQEARDGRRTRGRSNGCRATIAAAAPSRWSPGRPASRPFSPGSTTGSPGRCPNSSASIYRQIASAGTRRALLEKGDVDMSVGLPPKDYAELAEQGKVKVIGVPVQNDLVFVDMNVKIAPFDNPKVREAISYAIPYKEIISSALYNRAKPMFGGDPAKPYPEATWPVPIKHGQDLAKGQATAHRGRLPQRLQDHAVDRSQRIHGARADRDPDPGGAEDDRRRAHDREGAGLELVRPDGEQDDADGHRRILRLARLPRLLLLLDLSTAATIRCSTPPTTSIPTSTR